MKKTIVYIVFLMFTLLAINNSFFLVENVKAAGSTLHVGTGQTYSSIQNAIDAANPGDTIYVHSGTYNENIEINKKIALQGENKETTIIDGSLANNHTITVKNLNVTVKNLSIKHSGLSSSFSCIKMEAASNCEILNNILKESGNGLYLTSNSNNNEIEKNIVEYNNIGLYFSNGDNNIIKNNTIKNNNAYGIQLSQYSTGNIVYLNDFDDNNIANARDLLTNSWSYNSQGNYWDDYNDYDNDSDNIGDNPYVIDANSQDDQPLGDFLNSDPDNTKPIATIDEPTDTTSVYSGEEILFQGHGADSDSGDSISGYYWRSDKDGFLSSSSSFITSSLSVNYHYIYFKVKDNHDLWSDEKTVEINVLETDQKPIATITSIQPNPSNQGQNIQFNGYGTITTGDTITEYQWRSNITGTINTSSNFTTSNLPPGKHMIYFKVKDNQNLWSDETNQEIEILTGSSTVNHPPVALTNGPYYGIKNEKIVFDASKSEDEDKNNLTYLWNFGDGNNSTEKTADHYYSLTGNFTVSLTVTDTEGNYSTITTFAYISNTTTNNSENNTKNKDDEEKDRFIPSFELTFLIAAFFVFYIWRRKK